MTEKITLHSDKTLAWRNSHYQHFKPGELVLIRYLSKISKRWKWRLSIYSHYDSETGMHAVGMISVPDEFVIPYKGNEDKLGMFDTREYIDPTKGNSINNKK